VKLEAMRPYRSLLFMPANKPDWVAKALRCMPDGVILDLEDSVPSSKKADARGLVPGSLKFLHEHDIGGFVRINGFDDGGFDDIGPVVALGLTCIILPKADSADQIKELHDRLSFWEGKVGLAHRSVAILPLPETARGMRDAADLAGASSRVIGLMGAVLGSEVGGDTAWAAGFTPTDEGLEQLHLASKMVLDSRAAGARFPIAAVNGMKIDDHDAVRRLVKRARQIGFKGVAVIHPSHAAIANEVYAPSTKDIEYAEGLLAAMDEAERSGSGAARYLGTMIDYAMVANSRAVLADAERRGLGS
jgi:citrate lyase subunit beta / citryl-CoA lyase